MSFFSFIHSQDNYAHISPPPCAFVILHSTHWAILSINKNLLSEKFRFWARAIWGILLLQKSFFQILFAVLFRFAVIQFEWLVECFFIAVIWQRGECLKNSRAFILFFALSLLLSRHQVDLSCEYSLIPYCNFLARLFTEYGFIKFTSFSLALD